MIRLFRGHITRAIAAIVGARFNAGIRCRYGTAAARQRLKRVVVIRIVHVLDEVRMLLQRKIVRVGKDMNGIVDCRRRRQVRRLRGEMHARRRREFLLAELTAEMRLVLAPLKLTVDRTDQADEETDEDEESREHAGDDEHRVRLLLDVQPGWFLRQFRGRDLDLYERRGRQRRFAVITSEYDDFVALVARQVLQAFDGARAFIDSKEVLIVRQGVGDSTVVTVGLVVVEGLHGER